MSRISVIGLSGMSVFMSVDHFHKKGETLGADSIFEEAGGKGFNQAVAIKRLGCETAFLSAVGHDSNGRMCKDTLDLEGIIPVLKEKESKTAFAVILTDKSGENKVTVYRGASLDEDDVSSFEEHIASSSLLLLQLEVPLSVNIKAAAIAKKHGVPYILNPAPITQYDEDTSELCRNALFITPNEAEAKTVFGSDTDDVEALFERYLQSGVKRAVVTLGDRGSALFMNGSYAVIPAQKVTAVDTTGAGDVFNGAFCVKLAQNVRLCDDAEFIKQCAVFASKASAFSVQRRHVLGSVPRSADLR